MAALALRGLPAKECGDLHGVGRCRNGLEECDRECEDILGTPFRKRDLARFVSQDIGMHTRVGLQRCSSVSEAELYKRAFWNLVFLDRLCCAGMGRTLSIRDEE